MQTSLLNAVFFIFSLLFVNTEKPWANVFEKDDRKSFMPTQKPWTSIGKLTVTTEKGVGVCTGTLIGPWHIITAAHCVIVDSEKGTVASPLRVSFEPAYQAGSAPEKSWAIEIKVGSKFPTQEFHKDWAVIKLARPLGLTYGHIVPFTLNPKSVPLKVSLVGYSADYMKGLNGSFQDGCEIKMIKEIGYTGMDSLYYHDCDMHGGASGGPLITWYNELPYIVGINVAEKTWHLTGKPFPDGIKYSEQTANIAAPVFRPITQALLPAPQK
jgi:protease YdgD